MKDTFKSVKLTQQQMQFIVEVFNAISVSPASADALATVSQVQSIIQAFKEAASEVEKK